MAMKEYTILTRAPQLELHQMHFSIILAAQNLFWKHVDIGNDPLKTFLKKEFFSLKPNNHLLYFTNYFMEKKQTLKKKLWSLWKKKINNFRIVRLKQIEELHVLFIKIFKKMNK